jgi:hypothetical protein
LGGGAEVRVDDRADEAAADGAAGQVDHLEDAAIVATDREGDEVGGCVAVGSIEDEQVGNQIGRGGEARRSARRAASPQVTS